MDIVEVVVVIEPVALAFIDRDFHVGWDTCWLDRTSSCQECEFHVLDISSPKVDSQD